MHNRLIAIDPTSAAMVTLKFSGISAPRADSDAKLKTMVEEAVTKTEAKSLIVERLEKVRGLIKTIEGVGEIVGEVSRLFLPLSSDLNIRKAPSGHQGSMESDRTSS